MGHNIDLQWLLGLPDYVRCPKCKEKTKTYFDEYDIDCGEPKANDQGFMELSIQCDHCEEDFTQKLRVTYEKEE